MNSIPHIKPHAYITCFLIEEREKEIIHKTIQYVQFQSVQPTN
jgi:hypothetical protein